MFFFVASQSIFSTNFKTVKQFRSYLKAENSLKGTEYFFV